MMNREQLKELLPHRENMLLLDEAELIDGVACGKKKITGDEFFLQGHFPGNPIVPGVILCEILAQSACVLLADTISGKVLTLFTGLDKVRFKKQVKPRTVLLGKRTRICRRGVVCTGRVLVCRCP